MGKSAQADMVALCGPNPAQLPACLGPSILRDPVAFPRYLTVTGGWLLSLCQAYVVPMGHLYRTA